MKSAEAAPEPPALHWSIVLLLSLATLGVFCMGWAIVQARWAKKIDPASRALTLYIISILISIAGAVLELFHVSGVTDAVIQVAAALIATFAAFSVKDSLAAYIRSVEHKPAYLSGLMTIFLGEIYLQYYMNHVRSFQRRAALAAAR